MQGQELPEDIRMQPLKKRMCRKGCGREALPVEDQRGKICKPCHVSEQKTWRQACKKLDVEKEVGNRNDVLRRAW